MASRILTEEIWPKITAAVKRQSGRCQIAVAYFGKGASKLLPLEEGSLLVVDMSDKTVKAGQTCPEELLKLINKGVAVHTVTNLHAKVLVLPSRAFVGSTNVSQHSVNCLVEAVVKITDARAVSGCRRFVEGLCGERVTPEFAKKMQKLYRPPKFIPGKAGACKGEGGKKQHSPLWVVPLTLEDWDVDDLREERRGHTKARAGLRSKKRYCVESFLWVGKSFLNQIEKGQLVIQAMEESGGRVLFSPDFMILDVRRYQVGNQHRAIVYLEAVCNAPRKRADTVVKVLGPEARIFGETYNPIRVRDAALVHKLLHLWPSLDIPNGASK